MARTGASRGPHPRTAPGAQPANAKAGNKAAAAKQPAGGTGRAQGQATRRKRTAADWGEDPETKDNRNAARIVGLPHENFHSPCPNDTF
jgi:hypothetical protein